MLILHSLYRYAYLLEFSHESGEYREITRNAVESMESTSKEFHLNGLYAFLDNKLVAIYVTNGVLFLRIADLIIPAEDIIRVERKATGLYSPLFIHQKNSTAILNYTNETDQMIEDDPTPFVEEEHFDFGLFVKNLLSDTNRQKRCLCGWGNQVVLRRKNEKE